MKKCVYAGSFDPLTNGHLWMIREGAKLFDELVVAIGVNPAKRTAFSLDDRLEMLEKSLSDIPNVQITSFTAYFLSDYARTIAADYILRGIRGESDYEYERGMRYINEELNSHLTSVFLIPPKAFIETSSSMVKGLIGPVGWENVINRYVPRPVYEAILQQELLKAFVHTWSKLSNEPGDLVFKEIAKRYSETHRHYHNLAHIACCLAELSQLSLNERSRTMIELAIWFHDIIYDVFAKNNELKSAQYFEGVASKAGIDPSLIQSVAQMIRATQQHEIPAGHDTPELCMFLDIDLSILGANPERFHEYDEGIRKEYSWVPAILYNSKRNKVLKHFLDRTSLFFTSEFRERYEARARENITGLLKN